MPTFQSRCSVNCMPPSLALNADSIHSDSRKGMIEKASAARRSDSTASRGIRKSISAPSIGACRIIERMGTRMGLSEVDVGEQQTDRADERRQRVVLHVAGLQH